MTASILVCDIDQVLCDTATPWWDWMNVVTGSYSPYPSPRHTLGGESIEYDLSEYFIESYLEKWWINTEDGLQDSPEAYEKAHQRLLDYWSSPYLYCGLESLKGASEALQRVSEKGWWITFASYTKKGHMGSKFDFLEREFHFMEWGKNGSFVATKEKGCLKADVVIDDRNLHLNQFKEDKDCIKILYDTPFTQCEGLEVHARLMTDWDRLEEIMG